MSPNSKSKSKSKSKRQPKTKSETPPQNPHFKNGAIVEVSSDDDGFRGSWYTGKIIKRASSKNPNKYLIEYEKLFNDESGKNPLREILDLVQLRPLAPREKKKRFKFGDKVDAFHNDGWWEGSITEECKDGKFAVFFRGTREQIVFGEDDLRLHREWVDDQWKPPLVEDEDEFFNEEKKDDANEIVKVPSTLEVNHIEAERKENFSKGKEIEVSSDEEGFQGAWFAATIVEAVGKDKYLIEYKNLRTEDDMDFLREEIDIGHIRPCPPETIMVDRFKLLDEVDALYNDGWWVGVISKVLVDCKYIVYFRDSSEEMKFQHSDLRLHQDWIAGEWILPSSAMMM